MRFCVLIDSKVEVNLGVPRFSSGLPSDLLILSLPEFTSTSFSGCSYPPGNACHLHHSRSVKGRGGAEERVSVGHCQPCWGNEVRVSFSIPREPDHASCPHLSQVAKPVDGGNLASFLKMAHVSWEGGREDEVEEISPIGKREKIKSVYLNIVPIKFP